MDEAVAYSTLALTVALAVSRPRVGWRDVRITPGIAAVLGVLALLAVGLLRPGDVGAALLLQWRPLVTIASIMLMTGVVKEVGAFDRMAARLEVHARAWPAARVFDLVFVGGVVTPVLLNNDAAILLLTPVVVVLARRLYPGDARVLEALVFAVFLAPGVAPLVVSNPMNMIVAQFAGIGFNAYARIMGPISLAGALVTYAVLRLRYARALAVRAAPGAPACVPARRAGERPVLVLLAAVFAAYPVFAWLGAPIWPVAVLGAAAALLLARRHAIAPRRAMAHVSPDVLAFLWGVFLVVQGLRGVGVIDRLGTLYRGYAGGHALAVVGVVASLGSAVVDNHPMAMLNMLALGDHGGRLLLAALIGGDIGPRILPIGSLAGLLWMNLLRRRGIEIGIGKFVRVGALALIPTLAVSLLLLWAMTS